MMPCGFITHFQLTQLRASAMARQFIVLVLMFAGAAPVIAYDLRPSKISKLRNDLTHELLSIKSVDCVRAMRKAAPMSNPELWNCLPEHMNFAFDDYSRWLPSIRGNAPRGDSDLIEMQYLLAGVRWPDDPIGLARSEAPIELLANYALCKSWVNGRYAQCGNRFCISHFGHLQMAHSMKPSAPWCKSKSPNSRTCEIANIDTKNAIEAWVRWLVPIGKGAVKISDSVLNTEFGQKAFDATYCESVYPTDFSYQSLFFVDCTKDQWKKMFAFWKWGKCSVPAPSAPEVELRNRAIGAILHVIQDSYARGHTIRAATTGSNWCSSRISCTAISRFSEYTTQDRDQHSAADKNPVWDASCFKSERVVDDPITAGAKVLAMFEDPAYDAEKIWKYLDTKVFVTAPLTFAHCNADKECFDDPKLNRSCEREVAKTP